MERLKILRKHLVECNESSIFGVQTLNCGAKNSDEPEVLYKLLEYGVAVLTLNRPLRMNALTDSMQELFYELLEQVDADDRVKVIVIIGAGKAWCAGADMEALKSISAGTAGKPKRNTNVTQMIKIKKPIIAAINGPVAGVGLALAAWTDIRFASSKAKFTAAFSKRGLVAEHGISYILPKLVGVSNAMDVLISSRVFFADEAKDMGFVSRVYADTDTLYRETIAYAKSIGQYCSPASVDAIKSQVYRDLSSTLEDAENNAKQLMRKSFKHPDIKEGIESYVKKRDPVFEGLKFARIADIKLPLRRRSKEPEKK